MQPIVAKTSSDNSDLNLSWFHSAIVVSAKNNLSARVHRLGDDFSSVVDFHHLLGIVTMFFDLLLRIDELTSYIDGLTGGYFSKELLKRNISYG